tara:strand:- start:1737 stop:2090 length:354 start_codon:yes stop_codon:yes gene_type:complete
MKRNILKENMRRFNTKNLDEAYAWERNADGSLPTLNDATKQHQLNIKEQGAAGGGVQGSADYETKKAKLDAKMNSRKKVTRDQLINTILPGKVYQIWQTPENLIMIEDDKENWYELI